VFNIMNHFNPREVQNDIDSNRFGSYFKGLAGHSAKIRSGV